MLKMGSPSYVKQTTLAILLSSVVACDADPLPSGRSVDGTTMHSTSADHISYSPPQHTVRSYDSTRILMSKTVAAVPIMHGYLSAPLDHECAPQETRSCYTDISTMPSVGECRSGVENCVITPSGEYMWKGICENQVLPQEESCNYRDDDCDGLTDIGRTGEDLCPPLNLDPCARIIDVMSLPGAPENTYPSWYSLDQNTLIMGRIFDTRENKYVVYMIEDIEAMQPMMRRLEDVITELREFEYGYIPHVLQEGMLTLQGCSYGGGGCNNALKVDLRQHSVSQHIVGEVEGIDTIIQLFPIPDGLIMSASMNNGAQQGIYLAHHSGTFVEITPPNGYENAFSGRLEFSVGGEMILINNNWSQLFFFPYSQDAAPPVYEGIHINFPLDRRVITPEGFVFSASRDNQNWFNTDLVRYTRGTAEISYLTQTQYSEFSPTADERFVAYVSQEPQSGNPMATSIVLSSLQTQNTYTLVRLESEGIGSPAIDTDKIAYSSIPSSLMICWIGSHVQ